ncbi:MAG: flagellar hook-basal body complex protein [Pelotomaculum sp.]|uniref:Flagellar hook protein FlgE n=1 Tax=Pelotomaculum thermopropionicum (strain DSM 13744 / JCM 10971 / SI) TaxID=370438 RepID=A5D0I6_PELTS|nr:flagellar hook-basal body complex protein [Pelotomaculum sp.]BAF60261.1 flagellar hook protein FlgE [Pelotomaculum thermopropionicum SI]
MLRSLYAGASGLRSHQTRMDVIGNNIANVNTIGFKGSRANFQDVLYQTIRFGSAGSDNTGGVNKSQVGLGVTVASITNNTGPGGMQSTGRDLDLAINGNGWFMVKPDASQDEVYYTREGTFYIDNNGYLVNSNGYYLLDVSGNTIQFPSEGVASINISKDGIISYTPLGGEMVENAFQIGLAMFPNQDGLERVGSNTFKESLTSGAALDEKTPNSGGLGTINSGYLEMSNVDLTDEFTNMISTQRGYQANARTITVTDQMIEELLALKR